jgi:hypothetical protein
MVLLVGAWLSTASIAAADSGTHAPDPNLGVLNQGTRTLNFDDGWRFKLVNTSDTTDPSGTYGNSSDPKAAAAGFDDSGWESVT